MKAFWIWIGLLVLPWPLQASDKEQQVAATLKAAAKLGDTPVTLLDAVQKTIQNSPDIVQHQLTVEISRALEDINAGAFDVTVSANLDVSRKTTPVGELYALFDDMEYNTRSSSLQVGLSKYFRSGVEASLSGNVYREDIINAPPSWLTSNTGEVSFKLNIPLLKNSGSPVAAADETAARLDREAEEAHLTHIIGEVVLNTVKAYWTYKAAVVRFYTHKYSEIRITRWQTELTANPQEQERLKGYLADKSRVMAELLEQVSASRSDLVLAMGIAAADLKGIGEPGSNFDPLSIAGTYQPGMAEQWVQLALNNRLDLKAANLHQQASAALLHRARHNLKPSLDLDLYVGYMGLVESNEGRAMWDSLHTHVPGPSAGAALNFSYPFGNRTAKGQVAMQNAYNQQNLIAKTELERTINMGIGTLADGLEGRLEVAKKTKETADSYQQSMRNVLQDKKQAIDVANLLDLEERFMKAADQELDAVLELAKTIAEVRHNTGTLFNPDDGGSQINFEDLTSLPSL